MGKEIPFHKLNIFQEVFVLLFINDEKETIPLDLLIPIQTEVTSISVSDNVVMVEFSDLDDAYMESDCAVFTNISDVNEYISDMIIKEINESEEYIENLRKLLAAKKEGVKSKNDKKKKNS